MSRQTRLATMAVAAAMVGTATHGKAQTGGLECFERAWLARYETPSIPYKILWIDHRAVVVDSTVPTLVNFSDPTNPQHITDLPALEGGVQQMVLDGQFLYAAYRALPGGVRVFDMADPTNPIEIGVYHDREHYEHVGYADGLIVATEAPNHVLEFIDATDPATLSLLHTIDIGERIEAMAMEPGLLIVAIDSEDAIRLYDVSDPTDPRTLSEIPTGGSFINDESMRLSGDMLWFRAPSALRAWNIADPRSPVEVLNTTEFGSPIRFDVRGENAIIEAFEILTVDVSDPAAPVLMHKHVRQGGSPQAISMVPAAVGDTPLAAILDIAGLHLLNFQVDADPLIASTDAFDNYDAQFARDLVAHVSNQFLHITDASDPAAPTTIGELRFDGRTRFVRTNGQLAIVGEQDVGLWIIDLSDPTQPTVVSFIEPTFAPSDGAFLPDRPVVALAMGPAGVAFLDITDTANPRLTGRFGTSTDAQDVEVRGNLVFVADYESGLYVLDATDADRPTIAAHLPAMQGGLAMAIDGDRLYFTEAVRGMWTFDISTPTAPRLIGHQALGIPISTMSGANGNRLLIGGDSLYYLDTTDPGDMVRLAAWPVDLYLGAAAVRLNGQIAEVVELGVRTLALGDCQDTCRVDLDGDGELTIFDFLAFGTLFDAGDLRADFDADGALTVLDYLVFLNEFDAGCP